MGDKFPNVDWYCDNCDDALDEQPGFDDSCGIWVCALCGQENSISSEEIITEAAMADAVEFLMNFDPKNFGS